jgi:phage terminase small subunit
MTPKQQRFISEYLLDLNASAAALRAGYKSGDVGRRLVTKSHVLEAIQAAQAERAKAVELTADMVLRGLLAETKGPSHSAGWGGQDAQVAPGGPGLRILLVTVRVP